MEFKDGVRDAFHLRELEPPARPITYAPSIHRPTAENGNKGRPKGIESRTVEKMLQIYRFLKTQSKPVYRRAIENALGFNCTWALMRQSSKPEAVNLETLGIAERLPGERTWVAWQLTERGRRQGDRIIKKLFT